MRLCAEEAVHSHRLKNTRARSHGHSKVRAFNLAADLPKVVCVQPCCSFYFIQDVDISSMSVQLLIQDTGCSGKTLWRHPCFPSRNRHFKEEKNVTPVHKVKWRLEQDSKKLQSYLC